MISDMNNREQKLPSERSFGFVFTFFFTLLGIYPVFSGHGPRIWALILAGGFCFLSIIQPKLLAIPNKIWFHIGVFIHRIMEPITLGLVYFLFVTPFGLLIRLFGVDLLRLKRKSNSESYWCVRNKGTEIENMKFQY